MKKILFALPALAFTLFLAFCQKPDAQETTQPESQNAPATDRGTCKITYLSNAVVTFCGTNTNTNTCNVTCVTTYATGVETGPFSVTSPITMAVTTNSPTGAWVTVVTNNGFSSAGPVFIPGGTCRSVQLADDCTVTFL